MGMRACDHGFRVTQSSPGKEVVFLVECMAVTLKKVLKNSCSRFAFEWSPGIEILNTGDLQSKSIAQYPTGRKHLLGQGRQTILETRKVQVLSLAKFLIDSK